MPPDLAPMSLGAPASYRQAGPTTRWTYASRVETFFDDTQIEVCRSTRSDPDSIGTVLRNTGAMQMNLPHG